MRTGCLTSERYEQQLQPQVELSIQCEFCNRHAVVSVEKIVHGINRLIWLCNNCARSKQLLKNWEVIEND